VIARARPRCFRREIGAHLRIKEDGGSRIDDVERFDHMLPLAVGIGGDAAHIFEIDLPARHGCRTLERLMDRLATLSNPIVGFEDAVNRLGPEGTASWKNCSRGSRWK
jgi:hypothetical protein